MYKKKTGSRRILFAYEMHYRERKRELIDFIKTAISRITNYLIIKNRRMAPFIGARNNPTISNVI